MIAKHLVRFAATVAILACSMISARPGRATTVSYTIDPARSNLTLTGDLAVFGLGPLTPEIGPDGFILGDFDTYHGSIVGDLAAGVLTFSGGSNIVADANPSGSFVLHTGAYAPPLGGTVDNYGMMAAGYPIEFRDAVFDITTGSLSDGAIPSIVDIPVTGWVNSPINGSPASLGGNGIWHPIGLAGLTTFAGVETLTLPFQRESGVNGLHVFMTGTLIATRVVPEPNALVLAGLCVVALLFHAVRRRKKSRSCKPCVTKELPRTVLACSTIASESKREFNN